MRDDQSSNQEYRLLDYVERVGRHRAGRRAVHIHLSKLKTVNKKEHHLRIAINTFENLVKMFEGQLFHLSNHDIFFVFKDVSPIEIDEAVNRIRYLFGDDPLANEREPGQEFSTWYDAENQFPQMLAVVQQLYDDIQKRNKRLAMVGTGQAEEKPPINPHRLGELIDTIQKADLSNVMRRQTVYAVLSSHPPQALFRELFISIADLRTLVLPNYNIVANRWLFQYLTETLDKRMLALLVKNDDPAIANSFSINLNISTVLSPEFLTFDASLRSSARGTIVIEMQMVDIYADIASFCFARDFLRDRGYRILLDGLNEMTLPLIDREKLAVDLIKLQWSPTMSEDRSNERHRRLRDCIEKIGKARMILCHVDSEDAVRFGHSIGIAMFQGRFVDSLVAPQRQPAAAGMRSAR